MFALERLELVLLVDVTVTAVDRWCVKMEEDGTYRGLSVLDEETVQQLTTLCLHELQATSTGSSKKQESEQVEEAEIPHHHLPQADHHHLQHKPHHHPQRKHHHHPQRKHLQAVKTNPVDVNTSRNTVRAAPL